MTEDVASGLRRAALDLVEDSKILDLLEQRFGTAAVVGSVDLDLMTWPDIDLYVPVKRAEKDRFVATLGLLQSSIESAGHILVRAVFNDEWTMPRGDYGKGYYWGLRVRSRDGETWKIDLWGWVPDDYALKLSAHSQLRSALADRDRALILQLKSQAMELPGFRDTITSWHIYQFVLSNAGRTLSELQAFAGAIE